MDTMQYAVLAGRRRNETAFSALPSAPTVPYAEGAQRIRRARRAVAEALHHLGDTVAPTPVVTGTPLCAD